MANNLALLFHDAKQRGELTGLHIDLEPANLAPRTHDAFAKAAELSAGLHQKGGHNLWAFWPDGTPGTLPRAMPYKEAKRITASDVFTVVLPAPEDIVFPKYQRSVLENPELKTRLQGMNAPVIIASGVYSTSCYFESVVGILKTLPDARVVMALDAVDVRSKPHIFLNEINAMLSAEQRSRLYVSNVAEILEALPA